MKMSQQDKKEMIDAKEYFQYFQNKHSDKQLDTWLKCYLPLLPLLHSKEIIPNRKIKSDIAKMKQEIVKGMVPMCYRG